MSAVIQRNEIAAQDIQPSSDSNAIMALISRAAMSSDYDVLKLEKLLEIKDRWDAKQAEQAFNAAMADFKKNPPEVIHDMTNKQYDSTYTSLPNFVGIVNKALGAFNLEASWEIEQAEKIKVTCVLSHELGHKRRVTLVAPPDNSGAKNPIQQIKSTITYLELATFQAVTGIVAKGANEDDDGNSAGGARKQDPVTAPDGYDNWKTDMSAVADEGSERLQKTWSESKADFRRHVIKFDESWWADMKKKAAKVKP